MLNTPAKRKPYTDLILQWAEHEHMGDEGRSIVSNMTGIAEISPDNMPKEFYSHYKDSTKAAQLIEIIREIDIIISGDSLWSWAHVMRVMIDEKILLDRVSINHFDTIICGMIPGKGKDNVRKNCTRYPEVVAKGVSYHEWSKYSMNTKHATNREICDQICEKFKPILLRSDDTQQEA